MKRFEELDHTADWAFRAYGRTLEELYENAAAALASLEGAAPGEESVTRQVKVNGIDREALLVNWLSEILFLQETRHETYHDSHIERLTPTELDARLQGSPYKALNKLVKAITYHDLKIEQTVEGWQATVVVDV